MTGPLIDRDDLIDAYWSGKSTADAKARAMAYLRSVLTPEALDDAIPIFVSEQVVNDLHRRIFGEDK